MCNINLKGHLIQVSLIFYPECYLEIFKQSKLFMEKLNVERYLNLGVYVGRLNM